MVISFEHESFLNANYMPLYNGWCDNVKWIGSLWCDDMGKHSELKGCF